MIGLRSPFSSIVIMSVLSLAQFSKKNMGVLPLSFPLLCRLLRLFQAAFSRKGARQRAVVNGES